MKEFPFSSMSLLERITEGQLDALKCAKSLKSQGVVSEDVVLIFHEMYLRKCEEYYGGEIISFMIVGLKEIVPYITKSVPEETLMVNN